MKSILLASLSIALILSIPLHAGSCSAACSDAIGCFGNCAMDLPDCGAICSNSGCRVTCRGAGTYECKAQSEITDCSESSKPPVKARAATLNLGDWALVRYDVRGEEPLADSFRVVASSSAEYGEKAARDLAGQERLRWSNRTREGLVESTAPLGEPEALWSFTTRPKGRCLAARAEIASRTSPLRPDKKVRIYVHGRTNGDGKISWLEPLYSESEELEAPLLQFARENLRVWGAKEADTVLEFFGFLLVTPQGKVGYGISGASAVK